MLTPFATAAVLVCPALVLTAAARDVATFTIPNRISLALAAAFPVAALASGLPLASLGLHLGLGLAALVLGMALFALRWIGGGDAKLFAATALWLGWSAAPMFLFATCLAGGALALVLSLLRSAAVRPFLLNGPAWVVRLAEPGEGVPYGVAIAAGGLTAFAQSPFAPVLGL